MTTKINSSALELFYNNDSLNSLLKSEIDTFTKRNTIVKDYFCQKCLNAHILKKAKKMKIDKSVIESFVKENKSEIGHGGYYLDDGELFTY